MGSAVAGHECSAEKKSEVVQVVKPDVVRKFSENSHIERMS